MRIDRITKRGACGTERKGALSPYAIGAPYGYILSLLPRLVPATCIVEGIPRQARWGYGPPSCLATRMDLPDGSQPDGSVGAVLRPQVDTAPASPPGAEPATTADSAVSEPAEGSGDGEAEEERARYPEEHFPDGGDVVFVVYSSAPRKPKATVRTE
eukprot:598691-Pyramimonas_sp.AAC.1